MLKIIRQDGFVILPHVASILIPVVNQNYILPPNPKEFLDNNKSI